MKSIFKRIVVRVLTWEAKSVIRKYEPRIVAVTGSVGKTSTKDAIFAVMAERLHVRKSEKSYNSELGVPLTILGLSNAWSNPLRWIENMLTGLGLVMFKSRYPEWLVLEVGADHPGDIKSVTEWLKPDIAVVTKIPDVPVHVEHFPSPASVVEEKSHLVRALKREGVLVLNADDENTMAFREHAPDNELITYGFGEAASVRGGNEAVNYGKAGAPHGMNFTAEHKGTSVPVHIYGSLGRSHAYPALAAIAVGLSLGFDLVQMAEALGKHRPPKGRMKLVEGLKGSTLIDDTYNSSPVALEQALEALGSLECKGRKIAVLGDMLELGRYSIDEHKFAGEQVAKTASVLVTVGVRARDLAESAIANGMSPESVFRFDDAQAAGKHLEVVLEKGDVALIKGSQGMRMEKAVLEAMAHPEQAAELLVRQEKEWLDR